MSNLSFWSTYLDNDFLSVTREMSNSCIQAFHFYDSSSFQKPFLVPSTRNEHKIKSCLTEPRILSLPQCFPLCMIELKWAMSWHWNRIMGWSDLRTRGWMKHLSKNTTSAQMGSDFNDNNRGTPGSKKSSTLCPQNTEMKLQWMCWVKRECGKR